VISAVLALVRFSSGNLFVTAPFYTFSAPQFGPDKRFDTWIKLHPNTGSPKSLNAKESAEFYSTSSTIFVECPEKAELVLVHVEFSDHSAFDWTEPGWTTEPYILDAARFAPNRKCAAALPATLHLDIDIDATGLPTLKKEVEDSNVSVCLQGLLRQWIFMPKLRDGFPQPSVMRLLLRIHRNQKLFSANPVERVSYTMTALDAYEPATWRGSWYVTNGGYRATSRTIPQAKF
jgi:hypothetical protein